MLTIENGDIYDIGNVIANKFTGTIPIIIQNGVLSNAVSINSFSLRTTPSPFKAATLPM